MDNDSILVGVDNYASTEVVRKQRRKEIISVRASRQGTLNVLLSKLCMYK